MYEVNDFSKNIEYGWVCPKCGRVMAPTVNMCPYCNGISDIATTLNPQYVDVNNTKTISGSHDKFFEIVRQVQEHGEVINPITEDEE